MHSHLTFYALVVLVSLLALLAFRFEPERFVIRIGLGVTLSGVGVWIWTVSEPSVTFSDFSVAYYPAGRAVIEDIPHLFVRCWDTPVCGFVNIPIVALLFTPFSMLTLRHAQWLFVALSLGSLILSLRLLWFMSDQAPWRKWLIVLLFMLNGPLVYSLKEGNLTHVALLFLIAGVVGLEKTWDRSAGVCFALAAIIKLPLLLFAVYFFGTRQWRAVLGYGLTLVTVSALSLWYAGWASHADWYREVILPLSDKGLAAFNVQSMEGVLLRLQDDARLYDWKPVAVPGDVRVAGRVCAALLVGLSCILFLRNPGTMRRETTYLELSMVLCLALLISPISWTHYYLFLLLPLTLWAGNRLPIPDQGGWSAAMIFCTLLISPPVIFAGQEASSGWMGRLMLSQYVLGALLLWGVLAYARVHVEDAQHLRLVAAGPRRLVAVNVEQTHDAEERHERSA